MRPNKDMTKKQKVTLPQCLLGVFQTRSGPHYDHTLFASCFYIIPTCFISIPYANIDLDHKSSDTLNTGLAAQRHNLDSSGKLDAALGEGTCKIGLWLDYCYVSDLCNFWTLVRWQIGTCLYDATACSNGHVFLPETVLLTPPLVLWVGHWRFNHSRTPFSDNIYQNFCEGRLAPCLVDVCRARRSTCILPAPLLVYVYVAMFALHLNQQIIYPSFNVYISEVCVSTTRFMRDWNQRWRVPSSCERPRLISPL